MRYTSRDVVDRFYVSRKEGVRYLSTYACKDIRTLLKMDKRGIQTVISSNKKLTTIHKALHIERRSRQILCIEKRRRKIIRQYLGLRRYNISETQRIYKKEQLTTAI